MVDTKTPKRTGSSTPEYWTPEKRLLQSRTVRRRLKNQPWTPEQNEARSRTLRGRKKSPEMRAKMYASRVSGSTERTTEWLKLYQERLRMLLDQERWDAVQARAEALKLEPEDVNFAVGLAFDPE